jgi:hypothetical protein
LGQLLTSFVSTSARYASGLRLCNLHVSINEASIAQFSAKSRDALARAKECEARVDRMLSDLQRTAEGPFLLPTKRRDDARFERPKCCKGGEPPVCSE